MALDIGPLLSRRGMMASLGAGALMLSRGPVEEHAQRSAAVVVHGVVTSADDGVGIAGIMVSNGRDVVVSDKAGRWELAAQPGDFVSLIKPAHWSLDSGPAWFRVEDKPRTMVFRLARRQEPERFSALLVADTQPANAREFSYVRHALLSAVGGTAARFAIHHGDVTGDALELLEAHRQLTAESGIAWYHCPGNHDGDVHDPAGDAFACWKATLGPTTTAFQFAGATFILLNNVEFGTGAEGWSRRYRGAIGPQQLAFVAGVLAHTPRDHLVVVSMHIPLASFDTPDDPANVTVDGARLLALLAGRPHTVSFAGHSHTTEHHYFGAAHGFGAGQPHHHHVLTATSGSWWSGPADAGGAPRALSRDGSPKGFHLLEVDGNRYTTAFKSFDPGDQSMARVLAAHPDHGLIVNVFDGGPRTHVSCEVEGDPGSRVALNRVERSDDYAAAFFAQHAALCKPWVSACPSSHIFVADCPPALARSGRLVVRIRDEYGRDHEQRVAGPASMPSLVNNRV